MKIPYEAGCPVVPGKRRRWVWVIGAAGGIALMAIAVLLTLLGLYTSRRPMARPAAKITQADREALVERWGEFQPKVARGLPAAPFVASAKDLDVFFSLMLRYGDCIHFSAERDTLRADLSLPLDRVIPVIGKGRYVNATDTFRIGLGAEGVPRVEILSAQVNGRPLPCWVKRVLGRKEFHQDIFDLMGGTPFMRHLKDIEVRDGVVVMTPLNVE